MNIILITSLFELKNLLLKKVTWLIAMVYTLFSIVICISDNLRESYFSLCTALCSCIDFYVCHIPGFRW